jgi:hypothetical protein
VVPLLRQSDFAAAFTSAKAIPGTADPATDGNAQAAGPGWPWLVAPGEICTVTHNGAAYMFTGAANMAPGYGTTSGGTALTPAMFTALGAATVFATPAEVAAGVATGVAVDPAGLGAVFTPAVLTAGISTGATGVAADANKVVVLDATGKVDPVLLPAATPLVFATPAEVAAGVATDVAIDPAGLGSVFTPAALTAGVLTGAETGVAADAAKIVILNAAGKIPVQLLDIGVPLVYAGAMDFATAAPPIPLAGHFWVHNGAAGAAIDVSWGTGTTANPGDLMLSNGTTWDYVARTVDLANYLMLTGGTMGVAALIQWAGAATAEAGNTLLDLKGGNLANAVLVDSTMDAGAF